MEQFKLFNSARWKKFSNAAHRPQPSWRNNAPAWFKVLFALGAATTFIAFSPVIMFGIDAAQPLLFWLAVASWFTFSLATINDQAKHSDQRR